MSKRIQGRFFLEDDRIIIDAEPPVMHRVRAMFDAAKGHHQQGKFTHKPISLAYTLNNSRDVVWLSERYPMEIDANLFEGLKEKAKSYESLLEEVEHSDQDVEYKISEGALPLALSLREHQVKFNNMARKVKRMLLADKMGLGKTASAISLLSDPEARPAIVVVPPHLCTQWEREIKRFLPGASTHVIRGFKNYDLDHVDVIITSYNRLAPWQDKLMSGDRRFKTLIMDEVHELRHPGTGKRDICALLSERADKAIGLSGTPIFNYGNEIHSVLDVISPKCLGTSEDFAREWSDWSSKVREPEVLNAHLKRMGLMLRRTPEDAGMKFGDASKHVITLDADLKKLEEIQNVAKILALSVLSGKIGEQSDAARDFDLKMRMATGVAKARPAAEFTKLLLEQGEKVLLVGWHRDVYEVWMKELASYNPVMYTGSESVPQKDKAVKAFVEGDSQVLILSLRSGAGIDGLQGVCANVLLGELDWSPHVMDQIVARLDRPGQTRHVQAFYLTIPDGSDPIIMGILNSKRSQHDGLVEGKESEVEFLAGQPGGEDRIRAMAESYLKSIGEEIPERVEEVGLLADIANVLRATRVSVESEESMQRSLNEILPANLIDATVEREARVGKRSRLDFLITKGNERVAVECKVTMRDRAEVYRQVRRYIEEANVTSVILYAPWHGLPSFIVDGVPVVVVDYTKNSI